jgi:NAD(P)-dependent dehydrogenase (short-subunit alcohol dehydrogenase family)
VVTGAAGGLGRTLVVELTERGFEVVELSRRLGVDVADEAQVEKAFAGLASLDTLVNNAALLVKKPLLELSAEEWDLQLNSTLRSAFLCSRSAFRRMKPGGTIVNVSSLSGVVGAEKFPGMAAYVAAKSGLAGLTEALAVEGRPLGIRVNAVSPGAIETPMLEISGVAGRAFEPAAVARVIAWLAGPESEPITGANLKLEP